MSLSAPEMVLLASVHILEKRVDGKNLYLFHNLSHPNYQTPNRYDKNYEIYSQDESAISYLPRSRDRYFYRVRVRFSTQVFVVLGTLDISLDVVSEIFSLRLLGISYRRSLGLLGIWEKIFHTEYSFCVRRYVT